MSFLFPYFGFPSFRRRRYYPQYNTKTPDTTVSLSNKDNFSNVQEPKNKEKPKETEGFSILGITLSSDDILIIGLLLVLYKEGVKDQSLFITLVMLLLDR